MQALTKEAIEDSAGISAEGIIQNHPDIENRAGLALTGMTVEEALRELDGADDGQKFMYFYGKK